MAGAFVLNTNESAEDLARAMIEGGQKEPFHLFNMDETYNRILHFKEMMPRVKMFYAMKSNDWEMMLKLAISLKLGFDCASPGEIYKIRQLGVNPSSIIFAIPVKTPEQMVYARESGVKHTTFDNFYELQKLKQYWPDANLLIRIRVDGDSAYKLGDKFGCDFDTEAVNLLEQAAAFGLKVVGVSFHVGSVCSSRDIHAEGLLRARSLFDHEARAGRQMTIVDIGGGFLSDKTDRIDSVAKYVNEALEQLFPGEDVQVIAEPGRYLSEPSAKLYNSIMNVRSIRKDNKQVKMIYMNDGYHGTLRYMEPWYTVDKFEVNVNLNGKEADEQTGDEDVILWGPSCDSIDRITGDFELDLPRVASCTPGDWLVFGEQGAYTWSFKGPFSSIEMPRMRAAISRNLWVDIKDCPVFKKGDFIENPDITAPLPSTLPPVVDNKNYLENETPTLHTF